MKDKFLSQCASDIRIKLQQLQKQDSAAFLDEMVQTATDTLYNKEEREAKAQEREKREETRHAQMLAALQGSPMGNPDSLMEKAEGKCLICRSAGHGAKECPNHDKSPKTACYRCHQLGHWAALCPWTLEPQVRCQAFPHVGSKGLKWLAPASPPVTDNHHRARAQGATGCGR